MPEGNKFPRVLVIGNSCLSNTTSNGRTIRNFLIGWDPEKVAQFYIQNEVPDFTVCKNYFRVTDGQALRSFIKGTQAGGRVEFSREEENTTNKVASKKKRRTPLSMLLRELVWNSNRWKGNGFNEWLNEFSPDVLLLQAGDSPFMLKIASKISKERKIPLVIYNSEVYYFKKFDYFRSKGFDHALYPFFHMYYKSVFKKTIRAAQKSVYNCDMVKKEYDKEFGLPSVAIYTATQAQYTPPKKEDGSFVVSYLGNLGIGRHENLVEIADALQKISTEYVLDVYGKIPDDTVKSAFENCKGINYKGFVSYDRVLEIMENSNLLVHIENFSDFYKKDLQYAFSTKIADSLATGIGFLLYAPKEMACSQYLEENKAAFVVNDKQELYKTLRYLTENPHECRKFSHSAVDLAKKNHDFNKNAEAFQRVLKDVALGG